MPGVKKLAQESETQSKPEYIHGHFRGCLGVLIGSEKRLSCVPLSARIHDGLQATKDWENSAVSGESHVVEMIKDGCQAAQAFQEDSFYLLDRYFPTVLAFKERMAQNAANRRKVDVISRIKLSTVAYRTPLPAKPGQRGRKAVKGEKSNYPTSLKRREPLFGQRKSTCTEGNSPFDITPLTCSGGRGFIRSSALSLSNAAPPA